MNGAMADGLVGAWIGAARQPSDRLKKEVLGHLRLHLGDPRVERQSGWARASEETRQTVRGWLSALSLDAFFDLIGRFAGNAGMDHQWSVRRAFWKSCLKAGHIRDSWLVLGDNVARAVSDNADLRGSYGRLHDAAANQSVLLIQIGDLVFSEWNYNGRLRAGGPIRSTRQRCSEIIITVLKSPEPACNFPRRRTITISRSVALRA